MKIYSCFLTTSREISLRRVNGSVNGGLYCRYVILVISVPVKMGVFFSKIFYITCATSTNAPLITLN
ncbi:hypothetical protein Hanom_Chr16g01479071 [Helianthus anomalus]